MQDLAALYAMLANRGEFRPLRLRADEPALPGKRLLSAEASYMTMDMLRQHLRPDETSGAQPSSVPVYWKTGTSWSFRDAWTAGVFGPYVLVVWVGNFDNSTNTAFVGVDAAAPLFFQVVDALNAERTLVEPPRAVPPKLKRVRICLASGDLPNEWCPQQGWTWFIPGTSPIRVSTVHRPVVIDDATGRPRARRTTASARIRRSSSSGRRICSRCSCRQAFRADGRPRMRTVATRAGRGRSAAHHVAAARVRMRCV